MPTPTPPTSVMTFGDHLEELRRRVLLALAVPLPLAIVLFFFAEPIRTWMTAPLLEALRSSNLPGQLQALSPIETIVLDLKLAVIFALVLTAPWVLWQIWLFVRPGLYAHERRFVYFLLPGSGVLVLAGLALLFYVILPLMLTMLVRFSVTGDGVVLGGGDDPPVATTPVGPDPLPALPLLEEHPSVPTPGQSWIKMPEQLLCVAVQGDDALEVLSIPLSRGTLVVQQYRLSEYINFVLILMAGIAIAFQLPLVIVLLGWLDMVDLDTLRRNRKFALIGCAVVAAAVTPPDIVSMLLTWAPLYLLYELGILLLLVFPASRIAGSRRSEDPPTDPPADEPPPTPPPPPPPTPVPADGAVPRGSAPETSPDVDDAPRDGAEDTPGDEAEHTSSDLAEDAPSTGAEDSPDDGDAERRP